MIYRKGLIFLMIVTVFTIRGNAQKRVGHTPYKYYAIEDTSSVYNLKDSIRFITTGSKIKPTIFFIQGSNPNSLFVKKDDKFYSFVNGIFPFMELHDRFNIVVISKPGIPLVIPKNGYFWKNIPKKNADIYYSCNKKDYYISAIKQVYDFMQKENLILNDSIYLVGHSQGYGVVAKYAALFPNDFDKIVCMSSSIYNIPAIRVNQLNKKSILWQNNQTAIKKSLDSVYHVFENIYTIAYDTTLKYHKYYATNLTLWQDLTIDYLIQIEKPLLVVYGMNDIDAIDNSVLPVIFTAKRKTNLSVFAYPNYNHNFFSEEVDSENGKIIKTIHWYEVFIDVSNWLLE